MLSDRHITHFRQVSQLKILHFWVIGIERNVCRCSFNRYSVITLFAKLTAGEQLCDHCTHGKYGTLICLKVSPEKSHVLSCHTVVASELHALCDTQRDCVEMWNVVNEQVMRHVTHNYIWTLFLCSILLLGNSLVSEFYMPTFQNRQCVPKRWHTKFGITQKKAYSIQNIARVWNQEDCLYV